MTEHFTAHIRPARAEDLLRIAEIEIFNYRLNFYPIFRSDAYYFGEKTVPNLTAFYSKEPGVIENTVVYDDGVVKGFVRVKDGEIEKLFVEPVLQNRGIGDALFRYAAEALGGRRLWVLEKNPRAIRFYERHGFHLTEQKKRVDDTNEFLICMEQ
ncbi:MAG: GNAT family N-acetyltransferase [Clostridia bacterium]|nr:GNAT family N-acetyltransferase [Clostridia bacterium]